MARRPGSLSRRSAPSAVQRGAQAAWAVGLSFPIKAVYNVVWRAGTSSPKHLDNLAAITEHVLIKRFILILGLVIGASYGQEYLLGPGDLIEIRVIDLAEINGEYRVDSQGNIVLPYLDKIQVRQFTVQGLATAIAERLEANFLNEPQVIVKIKEYRSRPVSVIGAVKKPGPLTDSYQVDLLQVLSLAGGITERASDKVFIIRTSNSGHSATLEIDLEALLFEGKPYLNIPIFPGDTVNVPVDEPISVYITGEVSRPGEYQFSRKNHVTVLQLISKAGGLTDYAKQRKIVVKRQTSEGFAEYKIDVKAIKASKAPDFFLEANDIVLVP